jgi:4-diphosphocytidyl-2-C-methyl-D-erythritol kinase
MPIYNPSKKDKNKMTKKSYAKVNIFLKITGKITTQNSSYHTLASRFVLVKNLFDEISFINKERNNEFELIGNFGCKTEQNIIFKAYQELLSYHSLTTLQQKAIKEFFATHKIVVDKYIPEFAGLGGGSSNGACFLNMTNDILNLNLSKDILASIGAKFGADVPFFVYEYDSANVSGVGEIVQRFDEEELDIKVDTPNIECQTPAIFREFSQKFYNETSKEEAQRLFELSSKEIINQLDISQANDLYLPAKSLYPNLIPPTSKHYFSGSGSSFFEIL